MLTKEQKINKIGKQIGLALFNAGVKMINSCYDFTPRAVLSSDLQDLLKTKTGLTQPGTVSCPDGKYYIVPWETWEWIKDLTLIDQVIYYTDKRDCDNFAFAFASLGSLLFLLNSCGVAFGRVYTDDGKLAGYHAFNVIAVDKDGKLDFVIYEPMNDNWAYLTGNSTRLAHGWTYHIDWAIFF